MNYRTYIPNPALSKYIKCYWTLENLYKEITFSKEKVFPDGCIELVFHFGDLYRKYKRDDSSELMPKSFIHGQLKEFIEIEATGKTGILSIRFHPNGLRPFMAFDINEITGQTLSLQDLWEKEGEILEEKILNAASNEHRISLLEIFLLNKLKRAVENDSVIEHCVNSIIKNDGNISISKLANNLNIGRRHLERKFISIVGISPKLLSRIIRFQNTLNLIEHEKFSNLTMVAYKSGFYDQAHFIKDFKEFTGLNPKQYFSENFPLVKYFNLM